MIIPATRLKQILQPVKTVQKVELHVRQKMALLKATEQSIDSSMKMFAPRLTLPTTHPIRSKLTRQPLQRSCKVEFVHRHYIVLCKLGQSLIWSPKEPNSVTLFYTGIKTNDNCQNHLVSVERLTSIENN